MNIWFSSDFHLDHLNISGQKLSSWKSGYRDFDSLSEMNETILKSINKVVKYDDVLYFLGDFCFKNHKNTPNWRNRINCRNIHLIRGNHDTHIDLYKDYFSSIQDVLTVKHGSGGHTFFLSHYSHRIWYGSHKGVIHLYGHSHDSISDYGKSMDVGIDAAKRITGEYRPFRLEEIQTIMNKKEVQIIDHHNKKTDI